MKARRILVRRVAHRGVITINVQCTHNDQDQRRDAGVGRPGKDVLFCPRACLSRVGAFRLYLPTLAPNELPIRLIS